MLLWEEKKQLQEWLREDVGTGDITTDLTVPKGVRKKGAFLAKENGILVGMELALGVMEMLDPTIKWINHYHDGDSFSAGTVLCEVEGEGRSLLTGERLALNILQRLSGIGTKTNRWVEMIKGYSVKILDTRKTIPGMRRWEKYAVRTGGGCNHRFGLYDGILIKDNHIALAGGIGAAIEKVRQGTPHLWKVEIEVETLEEVREALMAGADGLLLDNMTTNEMEEAVKIVNGKAFTEASGGIGEERLREIAATGVDFISAGALTHSVNALDISFNIIKGD